MTNRPVFAWAVLGVCLLAATSAVGWLTLVAWGADQTRQQALRDSELRNALWRVDSIAAPLLAIECNRVSLSQPFEGTPVLAPRLIHGYVACDSRGCWTIRPEAGSTARGDLPEESPFRHADWQAVLRGEGDETAVDPGRELTLLSPTSADGLIIWPAAVVSNPTGNYARGRMNVRVANNDANANDPGELVNRSNAFEQLQQMAQQPLRNRQNGQPGLRPLQPVWVAGELVLVRELVTTSVSGKPALEFCWLNWPEWERLLQLQLVDAGLPMRLVPTTTGMSDTAAEEWQMVSLPLRLESSLATGGLSWPLPLLGVWSLLLVVGGAFIWLMRQTLALSERRAAFVSAVTHELRTPLTTFRLYTEMLSEGLASEPGQQQTYFQTLNREANRLTHLVENVLAYARLEHGRPTARNENLSVRELIDRCRPRLVQRTDETRLSLSVALEPEVASARLTTNALAVEQILFNLVDNSCKYAGEAADPRLVCQVDVAGSRLVIRVSDFGPGLSPAARSKLFQPFRKSASQAAESAPGIGLGLSLSRRLAEELRGSLCCLPKTGPGLTFEFRLPLDTDPTLGVPCSQNS